MRNRRANTIRRMLLSLFTFVCLIATIYSGYLLFSKQVTPITGSALLTVGVILLLWNWSLVRKHSLSGNTIAVTIIVVAMFSMTTGAYAGYEPMANTKDRFITIFKGIEIKPEEWKSDNIKVAQQHIYYIPPTGFIGNWKRGSLVTVKEWKGTDSKNISFNADKTPWVLNAGYKPTSQISVKFRVQVLQDIPGLRGQLGFITQTTRDGISAVTIEEKGRFTIEVDASGCEWWLRVGVEQ